MARVAMILRRSPYGDVAAAEAVRHALGAASQDLDVDLILMGSGVQLARAGQDDAGTGFTNLGSALEECIELGEASELDPRARTIGYDVLTDLIAGDDAVVGMF